MKYLVFVLMVTVTAFAFAGENSVTLKINGMTCGACVSTVEKALNKVEGVKEAKVDLKSNSATVMFASNIISNDVLVKAVSDAGFSVGDEKSAQKKESMKMKKDAGCDGGECADDCKDMKKTKTKKNGKAKIEAKKS